MPGKIFINYRRGDDPGFTQALYLRLEDVFTAADLFMDVESYIKPGDDFVAVLNAQVVTADVLLAVIGPRWTELLTARANDLDDFVAIEIKAALENNKHIIPVLVGGAGMPRAGELPEAIRPLARLNAVALRPERFKADCQGLITALQEQLRAAAAERRAAEPVSLEELRGEEELANWKFVEERNDVEDLRDHLARFPGGATERWALAKLDDLVWTALGSTPDITQLRAYLDEFPKGGYAWKAQKLIRAAEETAEWGAVAASTDIGAIGTFLKKWPQGQHADAARARIAELTTSVIGAVLWRAIKWSAIGGVILVVILVLLAPKNDPLSEKLGTFLILGVIGSFMIYLLFPLAHNFYHWWRGSPKRL